jgi:hypothetical protein
VIATATRRHHNTERHPSIRLLRSGEYADPCAWAGAGGQQRAAYHIVVGSRLSEKFADARDDLCSVEFDVGHEGFMPEAPHAVFQVEAGRAEGGEICREDVQVGR